MKSARAIKEAAANMLRYLTLEATANLRQDAAKPAVKKASDRP